jgi:hypothetical protein
MPHLAHKALQKAIFELLNGDSVLQTIVTGVYENPAPVIALPYLGFGTLSAADWSTKTTRGLHSVIMLHGYSRESKLQVVEILDRVFDLLQSSELTLAGHHLVAMRFDYNEITLENDGLTYHGVMKFHAYTEEVTA